MEKIKDTLNNTMHKREKDLVHPLEISTETSPGDHNKHQEERETSTNKSWNNIPAQAQKAALLHVKVYLDDFTRVVQGGPMERQKMTHHLFH